MDVRIVLALIAGWLLGAGFVYWLLRRGLDAQEWFYLQEFIGALRSGAYTEHDEDEKEGSADNGE